MVGLAVDHNIFKPLNIDKKEKTGLYFYRNGYLKNPSMMREAIKLMPGFNLYSYGQASCSFAKENHLNITDSQLAQLMNKASVFISTSIHEGFCLPLLEAMACGTPVITTKAAGNEIFCIDNVNCLMVESPQEIAEAVKKILTDEILVKRLVDNGITTANNYQWGSVTDRLEEVLCRQ